MCSEILVCLAEYFKDRTRSGKGEALCSQQVNLGFSLDLFVTEQVHPATYWWHLASEMPIESFEAMVRAISDTGGIDVPAEFSYMGSDPLQVRQEMIRELSKETTGHAQCEVLRLAILVNLVGPKKVSNTLGDKQAKFGVHLVQAVGQALRDSKRCQMRAAASSLLNAVAAAFPELGLMLLSTNSGKPCTS